MNTLEAIAARHSYRGTYLDSPVPREHLKSILEAGCAAPSGCNKQTTSFIAVDDPEKMAAMLGVPEEYELICYLPVGIPADEIPCVEKKPLEERAWFNYFEKTE